jgi:hypothetical protein
MELMIKKQVDVRVSALEEQVKEFKTQFEKMNETIVSLKDQV